MRFSLLDLVLGIIACSMGCTGAIALGRREGVASPMIATIAAGVVGYLLITPLLYRVFHLRPLLLPRCPNCGHRDRHWRSIFFDWPIEVVECAICKHQIELHHAPCDRRSSPEAAAFKLKWPHSLGGRWHRANGAGSISPGDRPSNA